jgi:hypothetical protein
MFKALLAALTLTSALLFSGCVSTTIVPLPKGALSHSTGATVAYTQRERADFSDFKPSNGMGGAVGGIASVYSGNNLIRTYDIPDPAVGITKDLLAHLGTSFHTVPQASFPFAKNTTSIDEIIKASGGKSRLILDVQSINWMCIYFPFNWVRYRVLYSAKLRLIDTSKGGVVAEGFFAWKTPDNAYHPTYDELFANNGAVLRSQLDEASRAAVAFFKAEVLKEKD